jgi:hypothetical protein
MPGSLTAPGRPDTRADAPGHVAFRLANSVGTRNSCTFPAQWLAYGASGEAGAFLPVKDRRG